MVKKDLLPLPKLDFILRGSGIAAAIIFVFSVIITGALHPDYSHFTQAISELGAKEAPYRNILNYGGLIPVGILTIIFSIGMFRNISYNRSLYVSCVLVMLIGLGRCIAGVFPCDPGCATFTSAQAKIHAVAGLVALTAGAFAPLFMAYGLRFHHSKKYYFLSLGLGVGALIIILAGILGLSKLYFGIVQRLLLSFTYVWVIVVAIGIGAIGNRVSGLDYPDLNESS